MEEELKSGDSVEVRANMVRPWEKGTRIYVGRKSNGWHVVEEPVGLVCYPYVRKLAQEPVMEHEFQPGDNVEVSDNGVYFIRAEYVVRIGMCENKRIHVCSAPSYGNKAWEYCRMQKN